MGRPMSTKPVRRLRRLSIRIGTPRAHRGDDQVIPSGEDFRGDAFEECGARCARGVPIRMESRLSRRTGFVDIGRPMDWKHLAESFAGVRVDRSEFARRSICRHSPLFTPTYRGPMEDAICAG
jgi:hypothetical protein